ncbi:tail fiber assembly protein [Escherichia coli]|nr:tail fiber assembly protein [Escherichia coli]
MRYVYSAKKNAFYPVELQDNYEASGTWPADGIEVGVDVFNIFSQLPPEGKQRIPDSNGMPAWGDIPPPTHDELVAAATAEKQHRIDATNAFMSSRQWPGKAAMGRLSAADKVQYNLWLDYLDALEAVDTAIAPDINWPARPAE